MDLFVHLLPFREILNVRTRLPVDETTQTAKYKVDTQLALCWSAKAEPSYAATNHANRKRRPQDAC